VALAQPSGRAATASEGADAPQEGGPVRRNHAKLYLGFTSNGGTDFTLGAEFNRRNRGWQNLAVAGFAELVFAEDVEFLLGATLQYYPGNRLVLEAGPGLAFNGGSEVLLRLGAGYELEPLWMTLVPKVHVDFIDGHTTFGYGVAIGRRF
jgi:hypothetical protein